MSKLLLEFNPADAPDGVNPHQLHDDTAHLQESVKGWTETGKLTDAQLTDSTLTYTLNGKSCTATITSKADDYTGPEQA